MAGQMPLEHLIGVRIPAPEPTIAVSHGDF